VSDVIDHDGLYRVAEAEAGYFSAGQALAAGMDRSTVAHHARPGGRYAEHLGQHGGRLTASDQELEAAAQVFATGRPSVEHLLPPAAVLQDPPAE
jgi:hypothetical protein